MLLTLSYVGHVVAAALWTGAVLYAGYSVFPAARAGTLGREAFTAQMDGLLRVTRWTGVALPVTGAYQVWRLYPVERLLGTLDGWLVLAMLGLWGAMNGAVELGVLAMRRESGPVGFGAYMAEGFPVDSLAPEVTVGGMLDAGRPYLVAALAMAVLLLVDAALLAAPLSA